MEVEGKRRQRYYRTVWKSSEMKPISASNEVRLNRPITCEDEYQMTPTGKMLRKRCDQLETPRIATPEFLRAATQFTKLILSPKRQQKIKNV